MAKGGCDNAVIGKPDEPLALDTGSFGTRLEHVAATGASSFASLLVASPLNVGMVVVVGWRGQEGHRRWSCLALRFRWIPASVFGHLARR